MSERARDGLERPIAAVLDRWARDRASPVARRAVGPVIVTGTDALLWISTVTMYAPPGCQTKALGPGGSAAGVSAATRSPIGVVVELPVESGCMPPAQESNHQPRPAATATAAAIASDRTRTVTVRGAGRVESELVATRTMLPSPAAAA
jgi:hypothetical protein